MSITINRIHPTDVFLEIGAGEHPTVHPRCLGGPDVATDVRSCHDEQGRQTVDFTFDAEQTPWPISSDEFDGLVCVFALEHISYTRVPAFLSEALRVLKPGCKVVVALPNTDAQLAWIQAHPDGWDGKSAFESMSEVLFGTQNEHTAAGHQSYWNQAIAERLFAEAGFAQVAVFPYGGRATDLVVEAVRPVEQPHEPLEQWHKKVANWPGPPMELSGLLLSEPCRTVGPGGVTCTKPKGHPGKHAAEAK